MTRENIGVKIISGKYKGRISVIKNYIKRRKMVLVKNINSVKKHIKANKKNKRGKVIVKEMPIDISNIKYVKYNEK